MKNPRGSDVPAARDILEDILAGKHGHVGQPGLDAIRLALSKLYRDTTNGRTKNQHRGWSDPALKGDILRCHASHSDWSRQKISIACDTNTARVSECLAGL